MARTAVLLLGLLIPALLGDATSAARLERKERQLFAAPGFTAASKLCKGGLYPGSSASTKSKLLSAPQDIWATGVALKRVSSQLGFKFNSQSDYQYRASVTKLFGQSSPSSTSTGALTDLTASPEHGTFYMSIRMSSDSSANDKNVILQSGNAATWLQCNCKKDCQTPPAGTTPYSPNAPTAQVLACDDPLCGTYGSMKYRPYGVKKCSRSQTSCAFSWSYTGTSTAAGSVVTDAMGIGGVWGNVGFGCSNYQKGSLLYQDVPVNGYLGLGASCDSVLGQLASQGKVAFAFSFCFDGSNPDGSKFRLGRGPHPSSLSIVKLWSINGVNPNYVVVISYLALNTKKIKSSTFLKSAKSVVEIGSPYTIIPQAVYTDLLDMMKKFISKTAQYYFMPDVNLHCFNGTTNDLKKFPNINVAVMGMYAPQRYAVKPINYLGPYRTPDDNNMLCFLANPHAKSFIILGETWLADKFIQLDVENQRMVFVDQNCTDSRFF